MKVKFFCLIFTILFPFVDLIGQDSTSVFRPVKIYFEYDLPDTVHSGFFCLVFYGHSIRSKYHLSILNYHSELDFSNVKEHRDSLRSFKIPLWRKYLSPWIFHPVHPPKAYLITPIDSSLVADQIFVVTIERKRLFGLIRQRGYCEASYQPERIYLVLGPHGFNRYSCNWAGNKRNTAE